MVNKQTEMATMTADSADGIKPDASRANTNVGVVWVGYLNRKMSNTK